ncbi:hypothetical protein ACFOET_00835 [Parapedobacter deserti]|uniref:MORN repeat-containing protein n=1 Tax=Parapedobacter deserti TaxID=1912957 RepID=A0ABV7JJ94_9SPHI
MNGKQTKPTIALIILATIAGGLALALTLVSMDRVRLAAENDRLGAMATQSHLAGSSRDLIAGLADADDLLFAGKYRQAAEAYQQLLGTAPADAAGILERRIDYATNRSDRHPNDLDSDNGSEKIDQPAADSLGLLRRQNDSLLHASVHLADSLNRRITELGRQIRDRNRALEQKAQMQVMVVKNADGLTIHYLGETKESKANGFGTGIWKQSGGVYKGEWVDNQRHGQGTYTWSDGEWYEGEFYRDKRNGTGLYTWPSGERYEGMWKDNKRHGSGVLYDPDGNVSYDGLWQDDKPLKK